MKSKVEIIDHLIEHYTCPILISNETFKGYRNAVYIDANCSDEELKCSYKEGGEKVLPKWYQELQQKSKNRYCLLVIQNLNEVEDKKQLRFKEMIKYGQINRMKLPENCIIFVTHSYLKENKMMDMMMCLMNRVD